MQLNILLFLGNEFAPDFSFSPLSFIWVGNLGKKQNVRLGLIAIQAF